MYMGSTSAVATPTTSPNPAGPDGLLLRPPAEMPPPMHAAAHGSHSGYPPGFATLGSPLSPLGLMGDSNGGLTPAEPAPLNPASAPHAMPTAARDDKVAL